MRKIIFFLSVILFSVSMYSQNLTNQQLLLSGHSFDDHNSIAFTFAVASKAQINEDLTYIINIDNVKSLADGTGFQVTAYANQHQFEEFLSRNIPYTIVHKNVPKAMTMATTVAAMANWDAYPTYSVYVQMLSNFATTYPTLCVIDTIMASTPSGNYKILAAKISKNVNTDENEPRFLYSSSMHGDETTGLILLLRLANYLLTNYGTISQVTTLVDGAEIYLCPMANPEGTYYQSNPVGSTVANSRRENLSGVDLNRNYPDPRAGQNPDGNATQPETQAFINFATTHHFNMSANFHGGAELTNFPWDTWVTSGNPNADDAWWRRVCTNYVTSARVVTPTYMSSTIASGVTEGGDWYVVTGGRQDYMNFFKQCREQTIELDNTKTTQTQNLNQKWNENYVSLLNYMQECLYGIRGVITDSCSGLPIRAKVFANGYDQANDSSHVYSALPVGNYHKYVNTGTYSLTYSAPGYTSKTITGITVTNGTASIRNIQLAPASSPDAQFTGLMTDNCAGIVQFTNTSAASTNFTWYFGDGSTSTATSPTHTYTTNGSFTVRLYATNCKGTDSLVRTNYIVINAVAAPTVTNASRCGSGTVDLSASGTGTINWYDAPINGNLVYTGTNYTTPSLSTTTTYYAVNSTVAPNEYVGKPDSIGGGMNYNSTTYYLLFDCTTAVNLKSVRVYASTAGNRTITLNSSGGAVLATTTVNVPIGDSRVTLNFPVQVGTGMSLRCTSTNPNMYRSSGGITYPYTLAGKISITGSSATGSIRYYFFYDWEIETPGGCASARIPVVATIYAQPVASFTDVVTSGLVTFTNTSTNGTTYHWTFGDGGISNAQDPLHNYGAVGNYSVQLIVLNGSCSDTITQQVSVTTVGISENMFSLVKMYPNPTQDNIHIDFGITSNVPITMNLFSMTGQLILSRTFANTSESANIDISSLTAGVYSIRLSTDTDQKYFKIFKAE